MPTQANIQLNTDGTGKKLDTVTTTTAANHRQVMAIGDNATDAQVATVTAANALKVDGSAVTQPVSGSVTANVGTTNGLALDTTLTGGTQQTKLTDGTNVANVLKSDGTAAGQNSAMVASTSLSVAFTTTTVQAVASTDAGNYSWVSVHITSQGTSSVVNFQASNDNSNWVSVPLFANSGTTSAGGTNTSSSGTILHGPLQGRYFRINVTGISAGTTAGTIIFSTLPRATHEIGATVVQATASNLKVDLSGTAANATALKVDGSAVTQPVSLATNTPTLATGSNIIGKVGIDQTTPGTTNGVQVNAALPAGTNVLGKVSIDQTTQGTTNFVAANLTQINGTAISATNPLPTTQYTTTGNGFTSSHYISAASTNATNVKASAGDIGGIQAYNNTATIAYLKIYDKASSPTVGTDTPVKTILIPGNTAGAGTNISFASPGVSCSSGISFAITGGVGDADSTAVAANAIIINLDTK